MGGQLLHVEQGETVGGEDTLGGEERKVGEMLVIDRVELVLLHQAHQMGELDGDDTTRLQEKLQGSDEIVEVAHLGENVGTAQEIGPRSGGGQLARDLGAEHRRHSGNASIDGHPRDVSRRLDAEHRDPLRDEVLQEVTVIAADFDDLAPGVEPQACHHPLRVGLGVPQPAVGVRREIGIVAEDVLGSYVLLDLDQEALLAHPHVQGIERLHLVELVRREIALAER